MIIEIKGVQFVNKGSELMLYSIIDKVRSRYPSCRLCLQTHPVKAPYEKYSGIGLYPKASYWYKRIQWMNAVGLVPKKIRNMYGIIVDREIDVVLDASGFSYTDQFGVSSSVIMAKSCRKWKKQGTKVILLPQAFGPFTSGKIRRAVRTVAENSTLVFARDPVSYNHLTMVTGEMPHISIAPDFTNLLPGSPPEHYPLQDTNVCIVPNHRMLNKTSPDVGQAYISFLKNCIQYLIDSGKYPFFLIHEGEQDLRLAREIVRDLNIDIPVIQETNPLMIKGILGSCEATIGSRFHGLVSALSQGIPSLATGWSHKYEMLFQSYGFNEGVVDILSDRGEIRNKLNLIVDDTSRQKIAQTLREHALLEKEKSSAMWKMVFDAIDRT